MAGLQLFNNMEDKSTLFKIFVGTAWDIYFLLYRNPGRPIVPSVKDGLKEDLQFFFDGQKFSFPDISQMANELASIAQTPLHYWECEEKNAFVQKYSDLFSSSI